LINLDWRVLDTSTNRQSPGLLCDAGMQLNLKQVTVLIAVVVQICLADAISFGQSSSFRADAILKESRVSDEVTAVLSP
jgi:hypothetical protein